MSFDRTLRRLFVQHPLLTPTLMLEGEEYHYSIKVLRQEIGSQMLFFNGVDGEWLGSLVSFTKKQAIYQLDSKRREQPIASNLVFAFAPLKKERLDYLIQKAVEMGAGVLQPVITAYTQNTRLDKIEAYAIEAAEQCGILALPKIEKAVNFSQFLEGFNPQNTLIFCDEQASPANALASISAIKSPKTLFIGPEGGFSNDERAALLAKPFVLPISLGVNILRADTAAVAALMLINLA